MAAGESKAPSIVTNKHNETEEARMACEMGLDIAPQRAAGERRRLTRAACGK